MKKIINKIRALSLSKKVQLGIAIVLTLAVIVSVPIYAWFTSQKKAAEMFKVKYPNSLYINAAHREDRIYFNLDGINTNSYLQDLDGEYIKQTNTTTDPISGETTSEDVLIPINHKYYVFSVSGSNTSNFILQLAHTNNNKFTYKVYAAVQKDNEIDAKAEIDNYNSLTKTEQMARLIKYKTHANSHSENTMQLDGDEYVDDQESDLYYARSAIALSLNELNADAVYSKQAEDDPTNQYYKETFGKVDPNTNVQVSSIPTYAQVNVPVEAANKDFCKYFILEVGWDSTEQLGQTSKETDMVYLSVMRNTSL